MIDLFISFSGTLHFTLETHMQCTTSRATANTLTNLCLGTDVLVRAMSTQTQEPVYLYSGSIRVCNKHRARTYSQARTVQRSTGARALNP